MKSENTLPREKVLKTFCTSAEAAKLLGVALRTVQLWTEAGLLEAWKTSGGHRRISRKSIDRLLVNPTARDGATPPTIASPTNGSAGTPKTMTILVVEDDDALRRLYQINLARWPMRPEVRTANDGYEALIRLGQMPPDLLVLDLGMPGIDGFRMLKTIAATPAMANTTIAVVSGLDSAEVARRGGLPPGVPLYPKPVPFHELRALAERLHEGGVLKVNP